MLKNEKDCGKRINKALVLEVKKNLPSDEKLYDLAELYKVFGDATRIKIISVLEGNELCVCDIAEAIEMSVSAVSHQLRTLKQARLVKNRKLGKEVYYTISDDHVKEIYEKGCEHIEELQIYC